MSDLLIGHDEAVVNWVAEQPFGQKFSPPYTAIGLVRDGHLTGAFVLSFKTRDSVSLSLSGRGCALNRSAWRVIIETVFETWKCSRLESRTSVRNKVVRKNLPKLGFRFEGKARRLFGRDDGLCFSLTTDDLAGFRKKWRI